MMPGRIKLNRAGGTGFHGDLRGCSGIAMERDGLLGFRQQHANRQLTRLIVEGGNPLVAGADEFAQIA
jgi:hypothetical protein